MSEQAIMESYQISSKTGVRHLVDAAIPAYDEDQKCGEADPAYCQMR